VNTVDNPEQYTTAGEFIRYVRLEHGLSLRQFARKLRLDVAYMSRVENQSVVPSRDTLERIVTVLGLGDEDAFVLYSLSGRIPTGSALPPVEDLRKLSVYFRRKPKDTLSEPELPDGHASL
jgi:transcriptional regulator with XRE-family HTH domain